MRRFYTLGVCRFVCFGQQGMHDSDDRSCDIFRMMLAGRLGFGFHGSAVCAIVFVGCSTVHYLSCVFVHAPLRLHIASSGELCKQLFCCNHDPCVFTFAVQLQQSVPCMIVRLLPIS